MIDPQVDRIGDEPGGTVGKDDVDSGSVLAREVLEVSDFAVGGMVCNTEESCAGFGGFGDPAVPNGAPESTGSFSDDHGVAQSVDDIFESDR